METFFLTSKLHEGTFGIARDLNTSCFRSQKVHAIWKAFPYPKRKKVINVSKFKSARARVRALRIKKFIIISCHTFQFSTILKKKFANSLIFKCFFYFSWFDLFFNNWNAVFLSHEGKSQSKSESEIIFRKSWLLFTLFPKNLFFFQRHFLFWSIEGLKMLRFRQFFFCLKGILMGKAQV